MKDTMIAIVPAAGFGTRFGAGTNKPFHPLLGKPLIVWSLELLETIDEVKEVIPVLKEQDMDRGIEVFERYGLSKIRRIAPGGKERQDSVYHGLSLLKGKADKVLIHDGARPIIDGGTVRMTMKSFTGFDGVVVGVPVKDTIKEVQDDIVKRTLRRDTIWAIQTPQLFLYSTLMKAYEKAFEEGFYSTDDSALVERNGGKVRVVMGSYANIKVTTPEDVPMAELLLKAGGKTG
jgi:2-C-methyl-D-erythritol 4-phosphate cytidylyltransferase